MRPHVRTGTLLLSPGALRRRGRNRELRRRLARPLGQTGQEGHGAVTAPDIQDQRVAGRLALHQSDERLRIGQRQLVGSMEEVALREAGPFGR